MLKKILLLACAGVVVPVATTQISYAQDSTSGAISGTVSDKATGEKLAGVTVIITSGQRGNQYTAVSGAGGRFKVASLPAGNYSVLFVFADIKVEVKSVRVNIGRASQLYPKIDMSATSGEVVVMKGGRANIDTTKTVQGVVIDKTFIESLPVPGRTFEGALETAAGAQDDGVGISFSGSSSLENQYVVDGVNTTGLSFGTVGSPVINEFVEEIEVITGGYMAEHGRSTGGVVNVVTQSGTNDFHGVVFTQFTNSLLQKRNQSAPLQSWIDVESNLAYDLSVGATLGGPIIKDKLWFFVGIAPRFISNETDRITKRLTDCRQRLPSGELSACIPGLDTAAGQLSDGVADEDDNGFFIYEELDRSTLTTQATEYQFVTKINYSHSPEHAGQMTFSGTPFFRESAGVLGEPQATSASTQVLTTDVSAKWTSKFNDSKTTLEAIAGMHRSAAQVSSIDSRANDIVQQRLLFGNFGEWARGTNTLTGDPRESAKTIAGCVDSSNEALDPYQGIENCPDTGFGYRTGGFGNLLDEEEQRLSLKLAMIQRVKAAGDHEIKVGLDVENNFLNKKRKLSGGAFITNFQDRDRIDVFRFVAIAPEGDDSGNFPDQCDRLNDNGASACNYTPPGDVKGHTLNFAAYAQDSWQILPNLTLNAGMRYEEQRLRNAEHLVGTRAQGTGQLLGENAMVLNNMWAPRVGLIYDWTKEGRSKVYGSWGRYYESVPMDINDRSFGAESSMTTTYEAPSCGGPSDNLGGAVDGNGCLDSAVNPSTEFLNGSGVLVASGLKAQYLDEAILGVEYEIMEDLKVGLSYQNRTLGRVLEDVSTDNAVTYVLANPGDWSAEDEKELVDRIDRETDTTERERLRNELRQFQGIRNFDKPRRDYNAVTATVSKRFNKKFFVQSSYTYSRTEGNYQGLFSSTNGQIDPNITSLFDLPELMANRDGALPQDRPHFFKFDGFYNFDFKKAGELTTGLSFRALSGNPINATGAHYRYGQDETMLLPRGSMGRISFDYNASIHVGYKRDLGKGMKLEGFVDFFNLNAFGFMGGQGTAAVDETYTFSSVNPVVGGKYEDLVFLKQLDQVDGSETAEPTTVLRNRNFGQARALYAAPAARIGARLTF